MSKNYFIFILFVLYDLCLKQRRRYISYLRFNSSAIYETNFRYIVDHFLTVDNIALFETTDFVHNPLYIRNAISNQFLFLIDLRLRLL